ncbi:phage shock protein PspA [Pleionea sp. CnH1-48]|uniref:phage shock protein PspA n=1 Tax=Pleionea sp. CnH1-48 TaxID=2954494 RepID=UPI002097EFA9|nr:phage shock protein PspA [Pleionea sp. CnH1-48]MCO7226437.1 phage shock protein PspA [Pleionea sp. CnH1-48]
MGVFSRISDIVNSNINALLDKAEDPEKLVKMIIQEMEQTLVEVRTASARTIADKKELARKMEVMSHDIEAWQEKAELAISKGREDLARAALEEKNRISEILEAQRKEFNHLEDALAKLEQDVGRLQSKLNEAIARRDAILLRRETLEKRKAVKHQVNAPAIDTAFNKFELFEKRMDQLEAEVEAMDLGQNKSLSEEIDELASNEKIDQELEQLKQKVAQA